MTRKGKIARLPRHIRDQLNHRLDDGEQGTRLVEWLNSQDDVKLVLEQDFDARPITEQNLAEWKQGGFLDWQKHQESRDWVRLMTDDASELAEDTGVMPLSDRLSSMAALTLGKIMGELAAHAPSDKARRDDFFRVLKELARLRRDDLEAARSRTYLELADAQRRNSRKFASQTARC